MHNSHRQILSVFRTLLGDGAFGIYYDYAPFIDDANENEATFLNAADLWGGCILQRTSLGWNEVKERSDGTIVGLEQAASYRVIMFRALTATSNENEHQELFETLFDLMIAPTTQTLFHGIGVRLSKITPPASEMITQEMRGEILVNMCSLKIDFRIKA